MIKMLVSGFMSPCFILLIISSFAFGATCDNITDLNALDCLREEIDNPKNNRDWKKYWNSYAIAEKHALKCVNVSETAKFLKLRELTLGTATLEAFSESVERLVMSNTKCFCEALLLLSETDQAKVMKIIVPGATIEEQQKTIDGKINKFCGEEKYMKLRSIYNTARGKQSKYREP